jgi:hypothetical protein
MTVPAFRQSNAKVDLILVGRGVTTRSPATTSSGPKTLKYNQIPPISPTPALTVEAARRTVASGDNTRGTAPQQQVNIST